VAAGDRHQCINWLRALLAALLLAAPGMSAKMAAETPAAATQWLHPPPATRFSELAEVTAANVSGLMPLVSRYLPVMRQNPQLDSSAGVDLPLQRFVDERTGEIELMTHDHARPRPRGLNCVVSYVVGAGAAETQAGSAPAALAQRELRAWDPIERHVLWSVREALPISSGALVTAGGLVFYGTRDGWFKALDARTGRILWKHRVDGRRLDEPMSYRGADGHQYIAVRALPRSPGDGRETLLLFALAH
jgi:hypothetical protein